jgi:hypothetical protein
MLHQVISIQIPADSRIQEEIADFSKEENQLMLEIGSQSIKKMKDLKTVTNGTDNESIKRQIETYYHDKMNEIRILHDRDRELLKKLEEKNIEIRSELKTNELTIKYNYEREYHEKIDAEKEKLRKCIDDRIEEEKTKIRNEYEKNMEREMLVKIKNSTENMDFLNEQLRYQLENMQQQYQSEKITHDQKTREQEKDYELKIKIESDKTQSMNANIEELREQMQRLKELNIKYEEEKKNMQIYVENQVHNKLTAELQQYQEKIDKLILTIDELKQDKERLFKESFEKEKSIMVLKEKSREEVCEMLKQTIEQKDAIIETIKNASLSAKKIGDIGEDIFEDIANETFGDFDYFRLEKTAGKGHSGDFQLHFDKMIILVDAKKYSNKINSKATAISKIKSDLKMYPYIKIAWVVSTDTDIVNFQNAKSATNMNFTPIIEDDVCVIYINSLAMNENPAKLLKTVWYISKIICETIMNNDKIEQLELTRYKQNEKRVKTLIERAQNVLKEHINALDKCKEHIAAVKQLLKEIINDEVKNLVTDDMTMVTEWLKNNIEKCDGKRIDSSQIHKELVASLQSEDEHIGKRLTHDKIKTLLTTISFFNSDSVMQKGKTKFEFVDYCFLPKKS